MSIYDDIRILVDRAAEQDLLRQERVGDLEDALSTTQGQLDQALADLEACRAGEPEPPPPPPPPPGPSVDIELEPGRSLQPLLNDRGAGVKVLLKPGTHSLEINPKDGLELYADEGAVCEGNGKIPALLNPTADGVKVYRVKAFRYAPDYSDAVIMGYGRDGWYTEDVEVGWAGQADGTGGMAIKIGHNNMHIRPHVHHCDQYGFGGGGKGSTVIDQRNTHHNLQGKTKGGNAGGAKIVHSRGFHLLGGYIAFSNGNGWWFDIDNDGFLVEGTPEHPLLIEENTQQGCFHEIGGGGVFRNFTTRRNGHGSKRDWGFYDGAICVAHSSGPTEVYGVTSDNDFKGIGGISQKARLPNRLGDLYVHDNTVINPTQKAAGYTDAGAGVDASSIRFERNRYVFKSLADAEFTWNGRLSAENWKNNVEPSAVLETL